MPFPLKIPGLSPAAADLGLGSMLTEEVADETEEMRKKRMAQSQERSLMGPSGSLATMSLFGGGMGGA